MASNHDTADSTDQHWLITETPDDWVATDHERVYFRPPHIGRHKNSVDAYVAAGEKVAGAFPEWTVIITGGPYRGYDVRYFAHAETKRI